MGRIKTNDDVFYIVGWALLVTAGLVAFILYFFHVPLPGDCVIHATTGIYCPGCGGTRSVISLLGGHILRSLYFHPAVLPGALFYAAYMISQTVRIISKGRVGGIKMRPVYVIVFLGLCGVNMIMKNVMGLV